MPGLWGMLADKDRRDRLAFIGAGCAALVGAGWAVYTHFEGKPAPPSIVQSGNGNIVIYAADLGPRLIAGAAVPPAPDAPRALEATLAELARRAGAGEQAPRQALDLLAAGKTGQAARVLQAAADAQAAGGAADARATAAEFRNLGVIAGLDDPDAAARAFETAIRHDPDDNESRVWAGWLALRRNDLARAETLLRGVPAPALGEPPTFLAAWAATGLADLAFQRGDIAGAARQYRVAGLMVQQAAAANPDQARWQTLSAFIQRRSLQQLVWAADRAVGQQRPAEAISGYDLAIKTYKAMLDQHADDADAQRGIGTAYAGLGRAQRAAGDNAAAIAAVQAARTWLGRLALRFPADAALNAQRADIDAQLAALSSPAP